MVPDDDLAAKVRAELAGTGPMREVSMFGGTAFMLRGNMLVAASPRGLLVRVGKEGHDDALSRPGARPMVMKGRVMAGYLFVDPSLLPARALQGWLALALRFVGTLPAKRWASARPRTKSATKRQSATKGSGKRK